MAANEDLSGLCVLKRTEMHAPRHPIYAANLAFNRIVQRRSYIMYMNFYLYLEVCPSKLKGAIRSKEQLRENTKSVMLDLGMSKPDKCVEFYCADEGH
jgi:hypothetical protein